MTVTSVLYRSAVDKSAIPYCNSDVVIKVGGRQVGSVEKLYDRHIINLQVGGRQVDNSLIGLAMTFLSSAVDRLTVSLLQYSRPYEGWQQTGRQCSKII